MNKCDTLITNELLSFRESIRHIWNSNFSNQPYKNKLTLFESFDKIELSLFEAIILQPLNLQHYIIDYRKKPLGFLRIKIKNTLTECDLRIGEIGTDKNCYWENKRYIQSSLKESFLFYSFFDWNQYDFIDLRYVKVWIETYTINESFENKWGLFDVNDIDFFISDK